MPVVNPFQAGATFIGETYMERQADVDLRRAIHENKPIPYILAPRQWGKSSLLTRTIAALDPAMFHIAFVDLSHISGDNFDNFWRTFISEVSQSFETTSATGDPRRDPFVEILKSTVPEPRRLVVFIDEIDALLNAPFRDYFFSKLRYYCNQRARVGLLRRLQFVLAGATSASRLIRRIESSPFNVGTEIILQDLSRESVASLAEFLGRSGARVDADVADAIYLHTHGAAYLCQLILERLWVASIGQPRITTKDVDTSVEEIISSARNIVHFSNIYDVVSSSPGLQAAFVRNTATRRIDPDASRDLLITGLISESRPFHNDIYRRVFGIRGPLSLFTGESWLAKPNTVRFPLQENIIMPLRRFFRSHGLSIPDAQDLVNDTLVSFLERPKSELTDPRMYLWGLARRKLWTHASARRTLTNAYTDTEHDPGDSIEDALDRTMRVQALLLRLGEDERTVFLLRCEGLGIEEIAAVMDLSPATVKRRLAEARRQIDLLAREDGSDPLDAEDIEDRYHGM